MTHEDIMKQYEKETGDSFMRVATMPPYVKWLEQKVLESYCSICDERMTFIKHIHYEAG